MGDARGRSWHIGTLVALTLVAFGFGPPDGRDRGVTIGGRDGVAGLPSRLGAPAPADRSRIATDETFYASLKGNPNSLNPILASSIPDERIKSVLYDYLFVYDNNLEWHINDVMVASYEEAPDHQSAIVKLKDGLRWHDGHALTAADVVFSWEQIVDDRVPAVASRSGTDQIAQCIALDRLTVKFVHKQALPTNKWNIMFGVIPKHLYERGKNEDPSLSLSDYFVKLNRHPIGNGPYRFVEWLTDDKIVFERWEDYAGPKPYFKRIVFRIIADAHSRLLAFERGALDEVELTAEQFALEVDNARFRQVGVPASAPRRSFYYIAWNADGSNPFFGDRRVRRAMSHATNYPRIIKQVFHGLFTRSYGLTDPTQASFNPAITLFDFDLDAAARLLDEAGWKKDPQDGWRYREVVRGDGARRTRFSFTLSVPTDSAQRVAAVVQADLLKIGVEMKTRRFEWATFLQRMRGHEFEALLSAFTMGVDPDQTWNLFHSGAYADGRNYVGYSNPRVDALFEAGRRCFDPSRRMDIYAELFKIVYDDAPYTFLGNAPNLWAFSKRVRGVRFSPRGPHAFHPGLRVWWVARDDARHPAVGP